MRFLSMIFDSTLSISALPLFGLALLKGLVYAPMAFFEEVGFRPAAFEGKIFSASISYPAGTHLGDLASSPLSVERFSLCRVDVIMVSILITLPVHERQRQMLK